MSRPGFADTYGATEEIVGPDRAAVLHERSGGSPLFLVELDGARDEELPESMAAVRR